MLLSIVAISALIFFVIIPFLVLKRYYVPHNYTVPHRILWTLITVVTWPIVPLVVASRHHYKHMLAAIWVSFLVFAVSASYWLVLHVNEVIALQQHYFLY